MSPFTRLLLSAITLTSLIVVAGCTVETERRPAAVVDVVAPRAPPKQRYEVVPPAPREREERVAWDPGHWRWDGQDWEWVPGRYVERPRREAEWEPGRWSERPSGGWVWIEGRWR